MPHAGEVAGPGVDSRCAGRATGRSHPARHPRGRGSRAPRRARASGGSSSTSRRSRTSARGSRARSPSTRCRSSSRPGFCCSISTDDPAMFDTDLTRDYEAARSLGVDARAAFEAGPGRRALRRGHAGASPRARQQLRLGESPRSRASLGAWPDPEHDGVARPLCGKHRARASARGPHRLAPSTAGVEGDMFFPKLRRQAKWVFVFLALSFAVGFVVFGVGGNGGGGPRRPPAGQQQRHERTIGRRRAEEDRQGQPRRVQGAGRRLPPGRKPRRGDHGRRAVPEGAAEGLRVHAHGRRRLRGSGRPGSATRRTAIQDQVTSSTGGATFAPPGNSRLGRALATGQDRPGADDSGQPEADRALLGPPGLVRARDAALPAGDRALAERRPAPAPARERRVPVAEQPGGAQGLPPRDQARARQRRGRSRPASRSSS